MVYTVVLTVFWLAVSAHALPPSWIALAVIVLSNALLELFSPRGTDDITMATTNALLCGDSARSPADGHWTVTAAIFAGGRRAGLHDHRRLIRF